MELVAVRRNVRGFYFGRCLEFFSGRRVEINYFAAAHALGRWGQWDEGKTPRHKSVRRLAQPWLKGDNLRKTEENESANDEGRSDAPRQRPHPFPFRRARPIR